MLLLHCTQVALVVRIGRVTLLGIHLAYCQSLLCNNRGLFKNKLKILESDL
jgi:hypothetical protein